LIEDLMLCEPSLRLPGDGSVNSFRPNVIVLFFNYARAINLESEVLKPAREAELSSALGEAPAIDDLLSTLDPTRD
jgi:hypothetical protein